MELNLACEQLFKVHCFVIYLYDFNVNIVQSYYYKSMGSIISLDHSVIIDGNYIYAIRSRSMNLIIEEHLSNLVVFIVKTDYVEAVLIV